MPCTPGCGSCCDPVQLTVETAEQVFRTEDLSEQAAWLQAHWAPRGPSRSGEMILFDCVNYDVAARRCAAYDERPQVCSGFPFYGQIPEARPDLGNVCGFQAELGRTVLPLVEVR